jgi:hypothetical protein
MQADDPGNFEEIVDGAGGSLSHLASLAVKHLRLLTRSAQTDTSSTDSHYFLDDLLGFLGEIDAPSNPLFPELLSHDLIGALTAAINVLLEVVVEDTAIILHNLFVALNTKTVAIPAEEIAKTLDAGLLRAIITYTVRAPRGLDMDLLKQLLGITLTRFTVYYCVASGLDSYLNQARGLAATVAFTDSGLFGTWVSFLEVAERRLALVEYFDSPRYSSRVACDCLEVSPRPSSHYAAPN